MARKRVNLEYEPSEYQRAIFDFIERGQGNLVVEAEAGSGKSWTLVKCLELMPKDAKILLTSFNNSIVGELEKKIKDLPNRENIDCRTIHSLGYSMLLSNYRNKINRKPDDLKYTSYIYNNINVLGGEDYVSVPYKDRKKYIENIRRFVEFGRYYLCQTIEDLYSIEKQYNIQCFRNEKEVALKILDWGKEHYETIDFTDMVWLPNVLNCNPYDKIYDWICIDECQDLEKEERELLLKCTKASTRILAVGQKIQCQPEGTKVLLADGTKTNIEDIKVGDNVVSFNERENMYHFNDIVEAVDCHKDNNFITIRTESGLNSTYTPEHISYARFNDSYKNYYGICLKCDKKNMFSLGIIDFDYLTAYATINNYANNTNQSKLWLLDVYTDKKEADNICSTLSFKYFLPGPYFTMNLAMYRRLGDEKIHEYVDECLKEFHRDYKYPIWENGSDLGMRKMVASNLIPKYMDAIIYDKGEKIYDNIIGIDYNQEEKNVYSLSVSGNHNYIADGILTHNCINSWKGADSASFDELKKLPNTTSLPLSISYRCPKKIVEFANAFSPSMKAKDDAIDGEILYNCGLNAIEDGDMVLCRTNAPLLQLYCDLSNLGKTCYIYGQDGGRSLAKMVEKTKESGLCLDLKKKGVFSSLYNDLFSDIDLVMKRNKVPFDVALDNPEIAQQCDNIYALGVISTGCRNAQDLIKKINSLFCDKKRSGIKLSTIHKAKGMECDNVYICCPSLLPAKWSKEPWEKQEERNLQYVAYTRAKKKLGFLNEDNFKSFSSDSPQKASNLQKKMKIVFELYGGKKRCGNDPAGGKNVKEIAKNSVNPHKPTKTISISGSKSTVKKSYSTKDALKKPKKKKHNITRW